MSDELVKERMDSATIALGLLRDRSMIVNLGVGCQRCAALRAARQEVLFLRKESPGFRPILADPETADIPHQRFNAHPVAQAKTVSSTS
jgi:hypothetical protein